MKPFAFFLCAGQQARWGDKGFKQLVDIGGEPLLSRSVRQMRSIGFEPIIVAQEDGLRLDGIPLLKAPPTRNVLHTICHTRPLWTETTLLCCGDVYWTDEAILRIKTEKNGDCTFYTNTWEIFAVRVENPMSIDAQLDSIAPARLEDDIYGRLGRIGHLYRVMHGASDKQFNYGKSPGPVRLGHEVFIKDMTTDIDTPQSYRRLLSRLGL